MILTLEVTGRQAEDLGAAGRKVFKAIGGTIGRLPDNDWVFPDPYVSGRHALIRYVNGKFFVEDTSTNGVFINSPDNRLTRGQPQQLRSGDLLYIDAYQINVAIENDAPEQSSTDLLVNLKNGGLKNGGPKLVPPLRKAPTPAPAPVAKEDRTESLALSRQNDSRNATVLQDSTVNIGDDEDEDEDRESENDHATEWFGMADVVEPKRSAPAAVPARPRPEVVKPSATVALPTPPRAPPRQQPPPPAPKVVPKPAPTTSAAPSPRVTGDDALMRALFDAAGIEGLEPSAESARMLGEILRTSLGGVMEVLRTREAMKDDLRMRGTSFKAAANNPLKFSANVDDAFHNLLVKHNPAYLQPPDAFEDAFRDVRDHQAAFLAAMRLAFESMLSHFDPQRMQEEFDRQMKGSILGVPAKLRYWDLYRDKYGELSKDAEAGFRTLFGDAFARAYEEHLERLRKASRPVGQ